MRSISRTSLESTILSDVVDAIFLATKPGTVKNEEQRIPVAFVHVNAAPYTVTWHEIPDFLEGPDR